MKILAAILLSFLCLQAQADFSMHDSAEIKYAQFVAIAGPFGDDKLINHMKIVLEKRGIMSEEEGSVWKVLLVLRGREADAIKILKQDSKKEGYPIHFLPSRGKTKIPENA